MFNGKAAINKIHENVNRIYMLMSEQKNYMNVFNDKLNSIEAREGLRKDVALSEFPTTELLKELSIRFKDGYKEPGFLIDRTGTKDIKIHVEEAKKFAFMKFFEKMYREEWEKEEKIKLEIKIEELKGKK